jgi:hypothetical protein
MGLALRWTRLWESPDERAVHLYRECGLAVPDIKLLIETMRGSAATHEEKLEAFYAIFPDRSTAEPCQPCAEAVLDAAAR